MFEWYKNNELQFTVKKCLVHEFLNPPMTGGGGWWLPLPTGFSNFSWKWEELFLRTNF